MQLGLQATTGRLALWAPRCRVVGVGHESRLGLGGWWEGGGGSTWTIGGTGCLAPSPCTPLATGAGLCHDNRTTSPSPMQLPPPSVPCPCRSPAPHPPDQLMSYGKGVGSSYVSDITLGFMEDTGHYYVPPGAGGSLVNDLGLGASCADTGSTAVLDFLFGNHQSTSVRGVALCMCLCLLHVFVYVYVYVYVCLCLMCVVFANVYWSRVCECECECVSAAAAALLTTLVPLSSAPPYRGSYMAWHGACCECRAAPFQRPCPRRLPCGVGAKAVNLCSALPRRGPSSTCAPGIRPRGVPLTTDALVTATWVSCKAYRSRGISRCELCGHERLVALPVVDGGWWVAGQLCLSDAVSLRRCS
jgi:hypothetical protein